MTPINFLHTHIIFCKNLQLIVRWWLRGTLRSWGSCILGVHISIRVWRKVLPLLTSWLAHGIMVSAPSSTGMMRFCLLLVPWSSYLQPIRYGGHLHIRHHDLDVMYQCYCHGHHFGLIEMLPEGSSHSTGTSFSHVEGNDGDIVIFLCLRLLLSSHLFLCWCLVPHRLSLISVLL